MSEAEALRAQVERLRTAYLERAERAVNDRRRLIQRLADAGLEDPDPKEGIRMELMAALGHDRDRKGPLPMTPDREQEWHEPDCAAPRNTMVEIQGVYDGALFNHCENCKASWHRWSPDSRLYPRAAEIMEKWAVRRTSELARAERQRARRSSDG